MRPPIDASSRNSLSVKVSEKEAFTLIELLVVIAIIALLASLLLPALQHAKRKVRAAECLSRQKQWALAFHLYADENGDWLAREGYHPYGLVFWNNWAQVADSTSSDTWYNALPRKISVPPASSYALPIKDRTRFYERASFFHCPSAPFPRITRSVGFQTALFSLAMNSQLVVPPNPSTRLSAVHDPSRTPLMLDNLLDDEVPVIGTQAHDNLGQPAAYASRFAGRRHGVGGNIAFVDGHAAFYRGEEVVETKGINAGGPVLPPINILWDAE
jgi:prepilin-type N-terminal cleavage/methylation domain-containing protein/prepilin-type processing-associated H-X9-DG protein